MLGQNNKEINNIERKNNNLIRRSVYAGSKINKGDYFNENNLSFKTKKMQAILTQKN